ncbi:M42 family metallopeptidase [Fusobacterium sp. PH5-44]|uniref:M42 family metallopeptidase n=1 Tax=unclassified Fusobacterium TaxID=2648384 RepID=UPI003D193392
MIIDMDYILEMTNRLIQVPSPSGYTRKVMDLVESELKKFNISYDFTKKGAIIASLSGKNKNYKKMISAHVDTIGAVVKKIKSNGRLELTNIGGLVWGSVEGENLKIITLDGREYEGTLLPNKASVHVYNKDAHILPRTSETMEVRLDQDVKNIDDVNKLGIRPGDFVYYDPRTRLTESGYIKSRYLDDKLCVAQILGYIKFLNEHKIAPNSDLYIYFSNYEEVGHGISLFPSDLDEFIAIDIGLANNDMNGDEKKVSIAAKDSKTPYDFHIRQKLVKLAEENGIKYTVDVYNRYGSDASVSIMNGFDCKIGCIGPAIDASHHYERTHVDGIAETVKLLLAYL